MTFPLASEDLDRDRLEFYMPGLIVQARQKLFQDGNNSAVPSSAAQLQYQEHFVCKLLCWCLQKGSCPLTVYSFSPAEGDFLGNKASCPTSPPCCLSCLQMTHCFL